MMPAERGRTGRPPARLGMTVAPLEDWAERASCRGLPDDSFFPPDNGRVPAITQRICDQCPVNLECLSWGLRHDEMGIWGGMTQKQRRQILKIKDRRRCPVCHARSILRFERSAVCLYCGISWRSPMPPTTSMLDLRL